ncbi:hypothetical protein ACC676_18610 [Rhizobium ruizarguesonis]
METALRLAKENPNDPTFAAYAGDDYQLLSDLRTGANPDLIASVVGALLKEGVEFFKTHLGPAGDPQSGDAVWNSLSSSQQNAMLNEYYNVGVHLQDTFQATNAQRQQWKPQNQLGEGGALYQVPGNETLLQQALNTADGAQITFGQDVLIATEN